MYILSNIDLLCAHHLQRIKHQYPRVLYSIALLSTNYLSLPPRKVFRCQTEPESNLQPHYRKYIDPVRAHHVLELDHQHPL
jgi:hypothetical protein